MIRLVYIAGSPRSGSTLLSSILGELPGTFNAGEMNNPKRVPFTDDHTVRLNINHNFAGNPSRFLKGVAEIRKDIQWESDLSKWKNVLISVLSFPLLKRYGY